ncbi:MAG: class I SAM-dependent methyltransferase [Pseudomonadota bacterium]
MGKIINLISINVLRSLTILKTLLRGPRWTTCSICKKTTFFYEEGPWIREKDRCVRCGSIPRWRVLFHVLETRVPDWKDLSIHESSPYGAVSEKLQTGCSRYMPTHYFPDVESGSYKNDFRCENLEKQSFEDCSFDLVITQDVLEHVSSPQLVFQEIHRTLKKGGKHIFTVPRDRSQPTSPRVKFNGTEIIHLKDPEYHGNPIDNKGSLVITDWGNDMGDLIFQWTGMETEVVTLQDNAAEDAVDMVEVFLSCKA